MGYDPSTAKARLKKAGIHFENEKQSLTVTEVCQDYDIDQAQELKKLSAKGITAGADDKMKRLAEKHDLLPINLYEMMR